MKLCKQVSRKYKEKEYIKHWIIIPSIVINKLGWKVKDNLDFKVKKDRLIIFLSDK